MLGPPRELAPPPRGNPGSATARVNGGISNFTFVGAPIDFRVDHKTSQVQSLLKVTMYAEIIHCERC